MHTDFRIIEDYAQETTPRPAATPAAAAATDGPRNRVISSLLGSPPPAEPPPPAQKDTPSKGPLQAPPARPFPPELIRLTGMADGDRSPAHADDLPPPPTPPPVEIADTVVEEVFESERFQPIKGWGHTWPGHFLPSDRVGHFSDRAGRFSSKDSADFEQVARQLPPGWLWMEAAWRVDLSGLDTKVSGRLCSLFCCPLP